MSFCSNDNRAASVRIVSGLALLLLPWGVAGQTNPPPFTPEPKLQLWYGEVQVRGSLGYKDNVTLSSDNPESSGFWMSGLEALAFRLPSGGWQVNALLDVTDIRYFDAPSVDSEQMIMAVTEAVRDLGRNWETALGFSYMYQNQVFDYSATYTNDASIGQIIGHTLAPRWRVRKEWQKNFLEGEWFASRQILEDPLDSFWLTGPRLTVGQIFRPGSEMSLGYQYSGLDYDNREQVDNRGQTIPDTSLGLKSHTLELTWTRSWGPERRWQSTTRAGWDATFDNGSGFYDFYQYRLSHEVRYRRKGWELKARGRGGYYHYLEQPVSAEDSDRRRRTLLVFTLNAERVLTKHWKVFAGYSWERSISNLSFDDYTANVISGGVGATF